MRKNRGNSCDEKFPVKMPYYFSFVLYDAIYLKLPFLVSVGVVEFL